MSEQEKLLLRIAPHEHQLPAVEVEGTEVLYPCLLCGLTALDALAKLQQERDVVVGLLGDEALLHALVESVRALDSADDRATANWKVYDAAVRYVKEGRGGTMPERVIDTLYKSRCEVLDHIESIGPHTHPDDIRRWAKELALIERQLDLRIKAGEPLPAPWQRPREGR